MLAATRAVAVAVLLLLAPAPLRGETTGSPGLRLERTTAPSWSHQLQFALAGPDASDPTFAFWPHEAASYGASFAFIHADQVADLRKSESRVTYRVERAALGKIELDVEMWVDRTGLEVRYRVKNRGDAREMITLAPCLQLPGGLFGRASGWAKAKRIFLALDEDGLAWIADGPQRRGVASNPSDPDPSTRPGAQFFLASDHGHPFAAHDSNAALKLFGVSPRHTLAGFIAASLPGGGFVAVATEPNQGVAFLLLDCLHVNVGGFVAAGETRTFRYRVFLHDGSLSDLLAEVEAKIPGTELPRPGPLFIDPDARTRILESFEDGLRGWIAENGTLRVQRAIDPYLAPSDRTHWLRADLGLRGVLMRTLSLPAIGEAGAHLSLDLASPDRRSNATVSWSDGLAADASHSVRVKLSGEKLRRVVLRIPGPRPPSRVTLRVAARGALAVDALMLHETP